MKFSINWLRQWVDIDVDTSTLVDKITMAGLEVDEVANIAGEFSKVIIGEIINCEKHPNADKLRVTQVNTGSESFQVVCGAHNAEVGFKAPFAMVGAVLPGDIKIKQTKIRGVDSFGMLCAAEELGLSDFSDGIMELPASAPVGSDVREYLSLNDEIINVDLTPNRADCLSIAGLSREISANFLAEVTDVLVTDVPPVVDDTFPVHIHNPEGCPRYVGRVIRNIDISRPSPLWLTERLRRSGIRSIDPVVDVTNYVMLELGQPMHGFDLDNLTGGIHVRMAEQGETIKLLDGQTIKLNSNTLVIADKRKVLAIAGVMGGEDSGVSQSTHHVFLESAFFQPVTIAGKARSYGLHTESSHRFERGVDFKLQTKSIERATALILEICGGEPGPVTEIANEKYLPILKEITLRSEKVTSLLGMAIENTHIEDLLSRLGLNLTRIDEQKNKHALWNVSVPSWRFDIAIEEDLVEELGRLYGYNNLPESTLSALLKIKPINKSRAHEVNIRQALAFRGYQETVSFSFIDPELHQLFDPDLDPVALANPISNDLSVMRTSLLPCLVKTAEYNLNRQQSRIRIFETGLIFVKDKGELKQEAMLAVLIAGSCYPENWSIPADDVDFFDLKGDLEAIFKIARMGEHFVFCKDKHPSMHPGQCASIFSNGKRVGRIGALHPTAEKKLGLQKTVYMAELALDTLSKVNMNSFVALSKYPEVRRDLALIVSESIAAGDIEQMIQQEAGELLRRVTTFDVYVGPGIQEGCKSLAMGLTLQHTSRTLVDEEINELIGRIVTRLKKECNATLRE